MEDAHISLIDAPCPDGSTLSLFAVLDGHCGRRVADLGSHYLPEILMAHPALGQNNALALVESVVQTDKAIFQQMGRANGGSTLVAALVHNRMLFVANLGDARAVVCDGTSAVAMSVDHKPYDAPEEARIVRCGGTVQFGRVLGCLAVSRALGDFEFKFNGTRYAHKEFMVSNVPDIRQINITDSTKYVLVACDGLWDVVTNEEAIAFVNSFLASADLRDLQRALNVCAQQLCQHAVDRGSMDNVTVVIAHLHAQDAALLHAHAPSAPSTPPVSYGGSLVARSLPNLATPNKRKGNL